MWTALHASIPHDRPPVGATEKIARLHTPARTIVSVSQQGGKEGLPVHQVACGQQFARCPESGHEGLALLHEGQFQLGGAYALLLAVGAPAPLIALPHEAGIVVVCCELSKSLHAVGVILERGAFARRHQGDPCPVWPPWPALCFQAALAGVPRGIGHA